MHVDEHTIRTVSITPFNTKREGNTIVLTDEEGNRVIIDLNWEQCDDDMERSSQKIACDDFVEVAEGFHTDQYRYMW